jgi:hypothetical protein
LQEANKTTTRLSKQQQIFKIVEKEQEQQLKEIFFATIK